MKRTVGNRRFKTWLRAGMWIAVFCVLSAITSFGQVPATTAKGFSPPVTATEPDIRDIRGPVTIPSSWMWIMYAAGGLAAAWLLWKLYRAWKRKKSVVPRRLPHEIALERLEQALALMAAGQAKEFSIAVSEAVRGYIEDRFHVRAASRTTEEFLHNLLGESASALTHYSTPLEDFLKHCDLAKFARWALSIPEMQSMHESARKFVMETQPRPEGAAAVRPPVKGGGVR